MYLITCLCILPQILQFMFKIIFIYGAIKLYSQSYLSLATTEIRQGEKETSYEKTSLIGGAYLMS
jgi:hypothetical protein